MSETRTLIDHDEIREWVIARAGGPVIAEIPAGNGETNRVLKLMFGQTASRIGDHDSATGGLDLVEWDEWFEVFEKENLALVIGEEKAGQVDSFHQLLKR